MEFKIMFFPYWEYYGWFLNRNKLQKPNFLPHHLIQNTSCQISHFYDY